MFDRIEHVRNISVDLLERAFAYENAVTGELSIVPLPPSVLQAWLKEDAGQAVSHPSMEEPAPTPARGSR